eukprot:COSAG06_NODE_4771_length_3966_cov_2.491337_1_plen_42_part_10
MITLRSFKVAREGDTGKRCLEQQLRCRLTPEPARGVLVNPTK